MTHERRAIVLSLADCAYYMVGSTDSPIGQAERVDLVRDDRGRVRKFPSLYLAKRWLHNEGARQAWLVMQTPYDEMVGRPEEATELSELPLILEQEQEV